VSLWIVPVPIGNKDDFTLRGLEVLRRCSVVIIEEFKESTAWLRSQGISGKNFEVLNEHSTDEDVEKLRSLCKEQDVALITDSGTPGFCDPGPRLIQRCRSTGVKVEALPGASSLMTLLSLSGTPLQQFLFRGFIPAENVEREKAWNELKTPQKVPVVLMDTPYRLNKMIQEITRHFPKSKILLGLNLTQENQLVLEGPVSEVCPKVPAGKMEFILILWP